LLAIRSVHGAGEAGMKVGCIKAEADPGFKKATIFTFG
jgi:hypothetical protein